MGSLRRLAMRSRCRQRTKRTSPFGPCVSPSLSFSDGISATLGASAKTDRAQGYGGRRARPVSRTGDFISLQQPSTTSRLPPAPTTTCVALVTDA